MPRLRLVLLSLVVTSLACNTLLPPSATPTPPPTWTAEPTSTPEPAPTEAPTSTPEATAGGVRFCAYVPGVSVSAQMPPEVVNAPAPTPDPAPPLPTPTPVDAATTQRQLRVYQALWDAVNEDYVYPDFNGRDWAAIGETYAQVIRAGLTDADFYAVMDAMLQELGDEHSAFQSPDEVREEEAAFEGNLDYVGIGVLHSPLPEHGRTVVLLAFPDSPAAQAGLRAHDSIVAVDGQTLFGEGGVRTEAIRGPEGTEVALTIQRPGEAPFEVTLVRRRISGPLPIDYCLVPNTRLGYIFVPGLDDGTIPDQMRAALGAMTVDGPLDGLILDNRENYGGLSTVAEALLGFFTQGELGHFVSRTDRYALAVEAEDVGGSQTVPLVILVDTGTASFAEVVSGVLQATGRARIVGQTSLGNVEQLWAYDFEDGSRAWIAHDTFEPLNLPNGIWEATGITPDVRVPTRWDLFTEATDPALAAAVELLTPDR
jgi:C-terminal peptidase prc